MLRSFGRMQAFSQATLWNTLRRTAVTMETDTPNPNSTRYRSKEKCINSVELLGRVGADPRDVGKDRPLVIFSLATNRNIRVRQPDESVIQDSKVTWHFINIFQRSTAEYALKYIKKGARILINGRLETRSVLKADGSQEKKTAVVVDDIILVRLGQRSETREGEDVPEQDEIARTPGADEPSGTDFSYELDHGSFTDQGRQ